jgi:multiple sugar transport system substrate-binding protein/putative aldouronate transport system substrate-binding protein
MFGIGSKVEGEKYDLLLNFLDWYASPEGMTFQHVGIEGLNYTVNEDGTFSVLHDDALSANLPVPDEYVGEDGVVGYSDGNNAINQWIGGSVCVNPLTGERFPAKFWASYKAKEKEEDLTKTEWQAHFDAENAVDYMFKHDMLAITPNVAFAAPPDEGEIKSLRPEINGKLCEYTWKAIFAKDDAEFEALWDEMIETLDGFDYDKLYENDVAVYTKEIEQKKAALSN